MNYEKIFGKLPVGWTVGTLEEYAEVIDPHPSHRAPTEVKDGYPFLGIGDLDYYGNATFEQARHVSLNVIEEHERNYAISHTSIGYAKMGNTIGKVVSFPDRQGKQRFAISPALSVINPDSHINPYYLRAAIESNTFWGQVNGKITGSTRPSIGIQQLRKILIPVPTAKEQVIIGEMWKVLYDKILVNTRINDNLQQQVTVLFRQMFIENENADRRECRADEYFNISIGKTPPRKEPQWFSEDPADRVWVSISDMGSCGLYISNSSEYLTHEAVERFNVKIVPDNTVLLSFKLTVGRIAITDGAMATNEAIAHFKTDKPEINEYLYCYLKGFNYQAMGSTSSIATAVNSKIIKGMPFIVPTDNELTAFHGFAAPLFAMIKSNQQENSHLATLRDWLLPKLMSGEIDVSNIRL